MKIDIKLLIIVTVLVYFGIKNKTSDKNELIKNTLIFSGSIYLILSSLNISCNKNNEGFVNALGSASVNCNTIGCVNQNQQAVGAGHLKEGAGELLDKGVDMYVDAHKKAWDFVTR